MVSQFSAREASDRQGPLPPLGKLNLQFPPFASGQPFPPGPSLAPPGSQPQEAITPQRRRADTLNTLPDMELEESPVAQGPSAPTPRLANGVQIYSLPPAVPTAHHSPTNPTLSSSYLDTPFHPSSHSMITPAPLRQNPRLAPPSTLVAPSKFMPESSPAGPGLFWKGLMKETPGQLLPDISPVKDEDPRVNGIDRAALSSSPPPMDAGMGSPSKPARSSQAPGMSSSSVKREHTPGSAQWENGVRTDERGSFGHSVAGSSTNTLPAMRFNSQQSPNKATAEANHEDDDDDGEGGFDLAKGFAPIAGGGFHSQRSSGIGVGRS